MGLDPALSASPRLPLALSTTLQDNYLHLVRQGKGVKLNSHWLSLIAFFLDLLDYKLNWGTWRAILEVRELSLCETVAERILFHILILNRLVCCPMSDRLNFLDPTHLWVSGALRAAIIYRRYIYIICFLHIIHISFQEKNLQRKETNLNKDKALNLQLHIPSACIQHFTNITRVYESCNEMCVSGVKAVCASSVSIQAYVYACICMHQYTSVGEITLHLLCIERWL